MLGRPVNDGFSGGERKRNELLQLALLKPKLAILDEIDSGMDVDGVRAVVALVQRLRAQGTAFVVVSHYLTMIEQLQPDAVLRLDQGRIAEAGDMELARRIARTGFARQAETAEA
jgi:Fe-S cluster assembly ATP-binding protein